MNKEIYLKVFKKQLPALLMCLLLVFIGVSFSRGLNFKNYDPINIFFMKLLVPGGIILFFYLISQIIISPQKILDKAALIKNTYGYDSEWGFFTKYFKQDLTVFRILYKNPVFIAVYAVTTLGAFPFLWLYLSRFHLTLLSSYSHSQTFVADIFFLIVPTLFILSFSFFGPAVMAFLINGEVLQTRIQNKKFSVSSLIRNFIYATPLLLILTFAGMLFLIMAKGSEDDTGFMGTLKSLSVYMAMETLMYFTYVNLGIIALENRPLTYSLIEGKNFFKQNVKGLFSISLSAGFSVLIFVFLPMIIYLWINNPILPIIALVLGIFFLSVKFISEQISILYFIIKTRYPNTDPDTIFLK